MIRLLNKLALVALMLPSLVFAIPDLTTQMQADGITVYRDRENPTVFYFLPNPLVVMSKEDGGPYVSFTSTAYSGSSVHGDDGTIRFRNTFFARLQRTDHDSTAYEGAYQYLQRRNGGRVVLREIPITRIEAKLVYTPIDEDVVQASGGFFEPTNSRDTGAVWMERDVFLSFDNLTAQVLWKALNEKSPAITLTYAFYADAWTGADDPGSVTVSGNAGHHFDPELGDAVAEAVPREQLVASDAIPIVIEGEFRVSRLRRNHLDGQLPPDYASLSVYCFDFKRGDRQDLHEKIIEVEATGAAGGKTRFVTFFSSEEPALVGRTVRFKFAIDLREPYRWRAEEVLKTGESLVGDWQVADSWTSMIDATGSVVDWRRETPGEEN